MHKRESLLNKVHVFFVKNFAVNFLTFEKTALIPLYLLILDYSLNKYMRDYNI